jgi:hypothetical protein
MAVLIVCLVGALRWQSGFGLVGGLGLGARAGVGVRALGIEAASASRGTHSATSGAACGRGSSCGPLSSCASAPSSGSSAHSAVASSSGQLGRSGQFGEFGGFGAELASSGGAVRSGRGLGRVGDAATLSGSVSAFAVSMSAPNRTAAWLWVLDMVCLSVICLQVNHAESL